MSAIDVLKNGLFKKEVNARSIKQSLVRFYANYSDEKNLQSQLENYFSQIYSVEREVYLDKKNIIDFKIDNVGIEVKIDGSARQVYRQLKRYAEFPDIDSILLVTTKTFNLPKTINGKEVYVYNLSRNSLISKDEVRVTEFSEGKYGSLKIIDDHFIVNLEPHVAIRFKRMFDFIRNSEVSPFRVKIDSDRCNDISWFMERYPLDIDAADLKKIKKGKRSFVKTRTECEAILHERPSKLLRFKDGQKLRGYQQVYVNLASKVKRMLNADELGLGKTIEGLGYIIKNSSLPAIVCVPKHLTPQWKDKIEEFTNCTVSVLDKGKIDTEDLNADIIITKYSLIAKHCDHLAAVEAPTLIFDEIHEIRNAKTEKYKAAKALADLSESVLGFSGTPLFNYADDIFNIMSVIDEGCLGSWNEFITDWCKGHNGQKYFLKSGASLRSYLKEQNRLIQRTREDVGMEMPKCNPLIYYVEPDSKEIKEHEKLLKELSQKVFSATTGFDVMRAAGDLDIRARELAGVAKAKSVAALARELVEKGEPVVIGAWHRKVHDILEKELSDLGIVFYTGRENSLKQKEQSLKAFKSGEAKILVMSLKSGAGVDGLQDICSNMIIAELAWSPSVLEQLIGRLDRPGKTKVTNIYYMMVEFASDPLVADLLGIKKNQSSSFKTGVAVADSDVAVKKRGVSLAENILGKKMPKKEEGSNVCK